MKYFIPLMLLACQCEACVKVEGNGIYKVDKYGDNFTKPDLKIVQQLEVAIKK